MRAHFTKFEILAIFNGSSVTLTTFYWKYHSSYMFDYGGSETSASIYLVSTSHLCVINDMSH